MLALEMLADWATPSGRDQVIGLWRPIPPRSPGPGVDALRPRLAAILESAPANVRTAAATAAASLKIKEVGARLAALAADREQADKTRAAGAQGPRSTGRPAANRGRPARLGDARLPQPHRSASASSPRSIPPRRSRRCATGSHMARPPSGKGPWRCSPPCPATPPADELC